uniref:Calponin-homology (CH) domain-containing protein n=1 Tax=Elaeophora elaphi TaxID=1147741 RepID=A0A158Q7J2_9BILA
MVDNNSLLSERRRSMDGNKHRMKRVPVENFTKVMSRNSEEKISDESHECGTIIWDHASAAMYNSVFSWSLLQNEFTSTPSHNLPNLTENTDSLFSVPYSPSHKRLIRQKTPSADNIYNSHSEISLHFSPGTNASNTTMKKKLELLKKKHDSRKTTMKKSSLSHDHISLYEMEEKFLSSVPETLNSINDHEKSENTDVSLRFPLNTSVNSTSNSDKATNATYVVRPLACEAECNFTDRCKKTEMDKKLVHLAALTSWLNYLLDEKNDANNSGILTKTKKDADSYLRKLLTSRVDIPAMKDNESQNAISYKCFVAANELSEMRARFRLLYESSSTPIDIATIVKGGKIAIRMDRQVYADIGNFHPFYLRLGLETVLSTNIREWTDGKSHLKIIASVVTQNIFKNPKIMNNRKYVEGRTKLLINDRGAEALLQHFLTKICQFLFIVDKAWNDSLVSRKNRCLFVKWSAYKSISDVVAMLSRELMTGVSNLPKTLLRLGLFLDRKQGFFEEFQYHVVDPLKDLSDGMILGRTVEILADVQYNTVIHCLRDPGGDRLRKVGNVKTVIDFAKQKGILPEGEGIVNKSENCSAETDSISQQLVSLFGISYEIRNPLELADGKLFSLLWKQYYSCGTPFELFDGETILEQIASAAEYHFGIPSSVMVKWKNTPDEQTLCLFTKIFISRIHEFYKITSAAVVIQRAFRRYRSTSKKNYDIPHKVMLFGRDLHASDRLMESSQIITEDSKLVNASFTIQRYFRGWLARTLYQKIKSDKTMQEREAKAVIIQKFVRGWLARTLYQKMECAKTMQEREAKAVIIQKFVRGWLVRTLYQKMKFDKTVQEREAKAIIIQKFVRRWLARKFCRKLLYENNIRKRENASIVIQKYVRLWLAQKSKIQNKMILQKRENAARVLQRCIRGWLARLHYQNLLRKLNNAAVTLQRYLRGWIARRKCRLEQRKEVVSHKQENTTFIVQNSISVIECSVDKTENKTNGCEFVSSAECLLILRELRKQHNRLRIRRQKFLQKFFVEDKVSCANLFKAERDRLIKAATIIQSWWRGCLFRKRHVAVRNKIAANRVARKKAASNEERSELMQPIINRVINAMKNLNSKHLYTRYKAAELLQKFVGLSELCAQYVFNNGGVECILDSLDGCNRGVGSTEVVIPLCSILWSVLKFKIIRGELDEQRRQDIMEQCYHFILAFHRVPNVVTDLSAIIIALSENNEQYEKAPYFVAELTKRFAKLSECDERVVAFRKLQKNLTTQNYRSKLAVSLDIIN